MIAEQNAMLLGIFLQEKLADPSDFDNFVGMDLVVDGAGRIVWRRVVLLVDELLAAKPHLAATPFEGPFGKGRSAVEWFSQQSDSGQGSADSGQELREQRTPGQGPVR